MTTVLISTDQDTEEGRFCPQCGTDWRADPIPLEYVTRGDYGHDAPCQKLQVWDDDYDEKTLCTCPPKHYSKLIGIDIPQKYDGVSIWMCPACSTRWDRWTGKEIPAENNE